MRAVTEAGLARADLLAEVTGILEGTSRGELDEPLAKQAAVPVWVKEGRRRATAARMPPFSEQVEGRHYAARAAR